MTATWRRVVVIGASAGGVGALIEICRGLPPAFAAPVCIVQHIGGNLSLLPELLGYQAPNPAVHAHDGLRLAPGTLYVAPPDRHMLLADGVLQLRHGPKENHTRPAIDPLFRSAALAWGPRVIGVVLTGQMDDGTAGLQAIKDCGGIAIVQDPATAVEPQMPRSALANVDVDHCVALAAIAPLLARLVAEPVPGAPGAPPAYVQREVAINQGDANVEQLVDIAEPSTLTCPDCGGGLWEMKEGRPLRYRCHTGHAYSALSLAGAQRDTADQALWSAVRALAEREMLLRRLATVAGAAGDAAQAAAQHAEAERLRAQIAQLQHLAQRESPDAGAPANA